MSLDRIKPRFPEKKHLWSLPDLNLNLFRMFLAEFMASFIYIFVVAGNVLTQVYSGNSRQLGLIYGSNQIAAFLVVIAMTYCFGQISGAQMNPVLTVGLMCALKLNWITGICFIILQFAAAFAALGALLALFPVSPTGTLGNATILTLTVPAPLTEASNFFLIIINTIFLVFGFLFFYYDRRPEALREDMGAQEKAEVKKSRFHYLVQQTLAPIMLALVYGFSVIYNHPWRVLSACLIANKCGQAWVWCAGGFLGAILGALIWPLQPEARHHVARQTVARH